MKIARKVLSIIGQSILVLLILFMIAVSLTMTIDKATNYNASIGGYRIAAISSKSMSYIHDENQVELEGIGGNIQKGDCVVAHDITTINDLKILDVVLYVDNNGLLVCHRVVEINVEGDYVITRGDTNSTVDGAVRFSAIRGKVVNVVPWIGNIVLFLQSYYGLLALFGSVFFITLAVFVYSLLNRQNKVKVTVNK